MQINITVGIEKRKIKLEGGMRPDLFNAVHLNIGRCIQKIDWEHHGIKFDGRFLSHLMFITEITIVSNGIEELQNMLEKLKIES